MPKRADTPVRAANLASIWIGLAIPIVVVGISVASWYIIESMDENSKRLRADKIKRSSAVEIFKAAPPDVVVYSIKKSPLHSESDRLYQSGNRFGTEQPEKAMKCYEQSIQTYISEMHGQDLQFSDKYHIAWCHHKLAECYAALSQYQTAIEHATIAINDDPRSFKHYLMRAKLYSHTGNKSLGAADVEKAHSLQSQSSEDSLDIEKDMSDMLGPNDVRAKPK
jgi:tetratricopeptide (TPR) repeat protein